MISRRSYTESVLTDCVHVNTAPRLSGGLQRHMSLYLSLLLLRFSPLPPESGPILRVSVELMLGYEPQPNEDQKHLNKDP